MPLLLGAQQAEQASTIRSCKQSQPQPQPAADQNNTIVYVAHMKFTSPLVQY